MKQQDLQQVFELNREIEQIKDIDVLLDKILSVARTLVNADAGIIAVKSDEQYLTCASLQNHTLQQQLPPGKELVYPTRPMPIDEHSIMGYVAITGETVNIPDAYHIPVHEVLYRFNPQYDMEMHYVTQSMVTMPLKNTQGKVIGVMQLINAKNEHGAVVPFSEEDLPFLGLFVNSAAMALDHAQMVRTMILHMISMAELRDPEIGPHMNRVGAYAAEIYEKWATNKTLPKKTVETNKDMLRMTAMLHDVGKVGIDDHILRKPAKLDPDEYEQIKQHTVKGARLFLDPQSEFDEAARQIALNHHECWDGTGYPGHVDLEGRVIPGYADEHGNPRGKQGEEIPLFARIVAIADVYDELIFREGFEEEEAAATVKRGRGTRFDPEMIDAFMACFDTIRTIRQRFPNKDD
jgi:HD-GYP domain-containing protein (c-di-GMP phosphodiesterase class II)